MHGAWAFFVAMTRWEKLRARAFRRDGYMCRECARYGRHVPAERAHHAWPVEDWPEFEWALWNLVSLCLSCHDAMHDRHSRQLTALGEAWRRRTKPPGDSHRGK